MLTPSNAKLYDVVRQDQVCPRCGGALITGVGRRGQVIVECVNFVECVYFGDECDYQADAPEDQQLRAQRAPMLPGFANDQGGGLGGGC